MLLFFINSDSHILTSGKLGTVPEISLEAEPHSSKMVVHDVRDKLKTYYYIMNPEKKSENVLAKAGKGGSLTYSFI